MTTTKDSCLFFKNTQNLVVNDNLNDQFINFNLNQKNQSFAEIVQSKNVENHNKAISNYDYSQINDSQTKQNYTSFGKTKLSSSFANLNTQKDYDKKEESKQGKTLNANSSTLSLHITAYENSIDDATSGDPINGEKDETNKKKGNISSIKNWKSVKESILNGSASVVKYAFELPRQQQDQNNDPEVMQFKASQRLSNVNQPLPAVFLPSSVATNAVSQQPPPATVNPAPSSSNSQPRPVQSDILRNIETTKMQESSSSNYSSFEEDVNSVEQLNEIRFSRSTLAKICHSPIFEKTVLGCFVRISVGKVNGIRVYRAAQVIAVVECSKECKVDKVYTKKALRLKHGSDERISRLEHLNNGEITNNEYFKWRDAMKTAKLPLPTTEFIQQKRKDILAALNYNFTEGAKKVQSDTLSDTEATKVQQSSSSPSNLLKKSVNRVKKLNQIRLTRFKAAQFCHLPTFDKTVRGCFVRIRDRDENNHDFYRAAQIIEVVESDEEYNIDGKRTKKAFRLKHGPDERVWRLEFISNDAITYTEYLEWRNTMRKARLPVPPMKFVQQKRKDIKAAFNYNFSKNRVKKETASSFTQTISDPEIERIIKENEALKEALQKHTDEKESDQKLIIELKEKVTKLERENLNLKGENQELRRAESVVSAVNIVENDEVIHPSVTIKQEPITLDDDYHTAAKRRRISFHESAVDNEMQLRFGRFQKESITLSVPLNEHNAIDVKPKLGPTCADVQAALPNQPNLVKAPTQCVYEYWKPAAEGSNHDFEERVAEVLQSFRYNLFDGEGEKRPLHLVIKDSLLFPTNFTQKYKQCLEIDAKYPQAVESITDVIEDEIEQQKNDYVVKNIVLSMGFDLATREPEITDAIRVLKSFLKKLIVVIREAFDPNGPKRYKNGNKENAPFIAEIPKLIILTIPFIPSHPTAATYNHQISHMNETIKHFVEEKKEMLFKDFGQIIEIYDWQKEAQRYDKVDFKNWESRYKVLTTALCEMYQMFTVENVE